METYPGGSGRNQNHARGRFRYLVRSILLASATQTFSDKHSTNTTVLILACSCSYLQTPAAPKPATLLAACSTADILGEDVRAFLTSRYVALLLAEYRRVFRLTDEAGQLDNVSRRFAWFRRVLSTHEGGLGRGFKEEWRVGWALVQGFTEVTRFVKLCVLSS